jgi:hypothetical protein
MGAVDHTMQDILGSNSPFDVLSVVKKDNREDIIYACITKSWAEPRGTGLCKWLLSVGDYAH